MLSGFRAVSDGDGFGDKDQTKMGYDYAGKKRRSGGPRPGRARDGQLTR